MKQREDDRADKLTAKQILRNRGACYNIEAARGGYIKTYEEKSVLFAMEEYRLQSVPQESNTWISVEDRLPDDGTDVIICRPGGRVTSATFYDGEFRRDLSSYEVTHWMPLPLPPSPKD